MGPCYGMLILFQILSVGEAKGRRGEGSGTWELEEEHAPVFGVRTGIVIEVSQGTYVCEGDTELGVPFDSMKFHIIRDMCIDFVMAAFNCMAA